MVAKVYEGEIDWRVFSDCILSTNWSRLCDFEKDFELNHETAHRAWHGKPVGIVLFLRICRRMDIPADEFLVEC